MKWRQYRTRKTKRCYGALARAIRRAAASGKPFDRTAVKGRWKIPQIARMLIGLMRRGELVRVKRGLAGKGGWMGVYRKA